MPSLPAHRILINSILLMTFAIDPGWNLLKKGLGSDDEVRLVEHLFDGYNPLIRPVSNLSDNVTVKLGMAMIQLISVDEKNQIMKSNVWLRMQWNDYQLKWDPSEFGEIKAIRILSHKVWKPDIVLFNNADGKYEVSYKPNVVIYQNGDVLWIPPAIYKSSCTIDVKYFPFDQQECEMNFGSWTFNGDQVALDWYEGNQKVDLSDYVNSGTWDICGCPGVYTRSWDPFEMHFKAQITFILKIRRKTLFYTVNLIVPCVLISFLSICVFYLPADAGEKMTMCISILLALVVFLLLVSKILPPTSATIPLIARYLLFTFIMNIITIVITVVIINWNFRTPRTHRMPRWVRLAFLRYLPVLLLMRRPHHEDRWRKKSYSRRGVLRTPGANTRENNTRGFFSHCSRDVRESSLAAGRSENVRLPTDEDECRENDNGGVRVSEAEQGNARMGGYEGGGCSTPGLSGSNDGGTWQLRWTQAVEAKRALTGIKFVAAHLKNEDDYAEVLEDWRYVALVIDRLQLYIFLAITVAGTLGILIVDQDGVKNRFTGNCLA